MEKLEKFLDESKTAYQACENAAKILKDNGFSELDENKKWNPEKGGKYFTVRDGSALIAFKVGEKSGFNIVASHADSPCFKIKLNPEIKVENYFKFNVERYGGGIFYSFLDRPLSVAGRIIIEKDGVIQAKNFVSEKTFVIPSVAIHFNRDVNNALKLNPQTDMSPIEDVLKGGGLEKEINAFADGAKVRDCDLFLVSAEKPFLSGYSDSLLSAPRIDNLTSVLSSVEALINCSPASTATAFIADNEEVGSATKQGAGSQFLADTIERICLATGRDVYSALANSFMVSDDNAHAVHPNHPELSDPTNKVLLGGGIVIKHHANQNYTTDAFSSSVLKSVFDRAGVKYQDFFMRSDLPCGGTLGAISSKNVSVRSVDIGLAQLAMHSAVETMCLSDYAEAVKGLTAFYNCALTTDGYGKVIIG